MSLKTRFIDHLLKKHPGLNDQPRDVFENLVSDQLLSPFQIELSAATLQKIQRAIHSFFELRQKMAAQDFLRAERERRGIQDPGNHAIMMSYDFHLNGNDEPRLIEINTNASFLVLGEEMYQSQGLASPVSGFSPQALRECVMNELRLNGHPRFGRESGDHPRIAIIDDQPSSQRLYIEFLVAREWFREAGWPVEIRDSAAALQEPRPDFIYNRWTDFFLETQPASALKKAYVAKEVCLSPHPFEYLLLADKERFVQWNRPGFLESLELLEEDIRQIRACLLASHDLTTLSAQELWTRRKQFFFKPKRAFGSKQAFRGGTMSRKTFDDLVGEDLLAQEFVPAPERSFETPEGPQKFKFDLRAYAYEGQLQSIVARLYQGQVTNLKTPYGGFAPVVIR